MSKKHSEDIFELIQTMTKSEKRYFKEFASRHTIGEINKIVLLFDAIEKQKEYDEEKAVSKIPEIDKSTVPDLKLHLYKTILRSLNQFYAQSNIEISIKNMLVSIQVLYEKSLFKQALKLIEKCKALAGTYEKYILLLDIYEWEKKIINASAYQDVTDKNIEIQFKHNPENTIADFKLYLELSYLSALFFKNIKLVGLARDPKDIEVLNKLIKNMDEALVGKKNISAKSYILYYNCKAAYYMRFQNFKQTRDINLDLLTVYEQKPYLIKENPGDYATLVSNLLLAELYCKDFKKIPGQIQKLRALQVKSIRIQNQINNIANIRELTYYLNLADIDSAVSLINRVNKHHTHTRELKHHEMLWFYNCAIVYFINNDLKKAKQLFQQIVNYSPANVQSDLMSFAKIILLIIYYELDDADTIAYSYKSTYHFLLKRNKLYKFESIVLEFLRKNAFKLRNDKETISAFKDLRDKIQSLMKDKFEKQAFEYFDFVGWLDSKITKKPFKEIAIQNILKHNSIS